MAKNEKQANDFSDMSPHDIARLVANTALVAKSSGGPVSVFGGKLKGEQGVMIWIPGYEIDNGEMNLIEITDAPNAQATH